MADRSTAGSIDEYIAEFPAETRWVLEELRALHHSVVNYHRLRNGIDCAAQDVLTGPGSKELAFILQVVYYGDLVIPTPGWVSCAPRALERSKDGEGEICHPP